MVIVKKHVSLNAMNTFLLNGHFIHVAYLLLFKGVGMYDTEK